MMLCVSGTGWHMRRMHVHVCGSTSSGIAFSKPVRSSSDLILGRWTFSVSLFSLMGQFVLTCIGC